MSAALSIAAFVPAAAQGPPTWIWPAGGHAGIPYVRLTPDGATLVSGATTDTTLKIWRAGDGVLLHTLVHSAGQVHAVAVSADGQYAATAGEFVLGSSDHPVVLWRIADGAFIRSFTTGVDDQANSVAFSPDGAEIAAGEGNDVHVWRVSDGAFLHTLSGHSGFVFSIAYSPDGTKIATGSADDTAMIWNRADGAPLKTLVGHTFFVSGVAWKPDGTQLATSSWDGTSRIWNVATGGILHTFTDTDSLYAVDWSSNGALVATGGVTAQIHLYDPATGGLVRNAADPEMFDVQSLAFSSDGASIVSGGADGHPRRFKVSDGTPLLRYGTHTGRVDSVASSPTGPELASSGTESGPAEQTIKIWDRTTGALLRQLVGHGDEIGQVTFSKDGTMLASCAGHLGSVSADHSVRLWNPSTGALLRVLAGHNKVSWRVAFTPDGATLASGGQEISSSDVKIWRVSDGALLQTIPSLPGLPGWLVYTLDGQFLLVGVGTEIRLYQTPTYALVRTIPVGSLVTGLALSPDGVAVAAATEAFGSNVSLWRLSDGANLWTAAGHPDGFAQAVSFAPDGATLISGSGFARDIRIWRASDGALLQVYDQETGWGPDPVLPLQIDSGGSFFVYGRTDATLATAVYPFGTPAVGGLTVDKNVPAGVVHLSWTSGTTPVTLRRAEDPQFTVNVVTLVDQQVAASFDDPVLNDGVTYYYEVH